MSLCCLTCDLLWWSVWEWDKCNQSTMGIVLVLGIYSVTIIKYLQQILSMVTWLYMFLCFGLTWLETTILGDFMGSYRWVTIRMAGTWLGKSLAMESIGQVKASLLATTIMWYQICLDCSSAVSIVARCIQPILLQYFRHLGIVLTNPVGSTS